MKPNEEIIADIIDNLEGDYEAPLLIRIVGEALEDKDRERLDLMDGFIDYLEEAIDNGGKLDKAADILDAYCVRYVDEIKKLNHPK